MWIFLWCDKCSLFTVFLQCDEADKLNRMLMEKCENALLESEMLTHMREQVCMTWYFCVFIVQL